MKKIISSMSAVLLGLLLYGCENTSQDVKLEIPRNASVEVRKSLLGIESSVSKLLDAEDKGELDKMSDTFDLINEHCDELQGKKKATAPSTDDWGNVSNDKLDRVLKTLHEIENQSELCRDYARNARMTRSHFITS